MHINWAGVPRVQDLTHPRYLPPHTSPDSPPIEGKVGAYICGIISLMDTTTAQGISEGHPRDRDYDQEEGWNIRYLQILTLPPPHLPTLSPLLIPIPSDLPSPG